MRQCPTFIQSDLVKWEDIPTVIYVMTPSQSHNHFPLFLVGFFFFFGRVGLRDPTLAFLCVHLCASHFLKVLYAIVSFIPKEHTDVGGAVKWPNKPE